MNVPGPPAPKSARSAVPEAKLDATDQALMRELADNARLPNNTLAERVGIAPSTCSMRLTRLRAVRAIRGFHADLSPQALGLPLEALIALRLQPPARARISDFSTKLAALPGVLNVYFLAGSVDFLIHVAAASTDNLRDFVAKHLSASKEFASTETSLIFEHVGGRSWATCSASSRLRAIPDRLTPFDAPWVQHRTDELLTTSEAAGDHTTLQQLPHLRSQAERKTPRRPRSCVNCNHNHRQPRQPKSGEDRVERSSNVNHTASVSDVVARRDRRVAVTQDVPGGVQARRRERPTCPPCDATCAG